MTYYGLADGVNQDADDAVDDDSASPVASLSAFNDTGLDAAVAYVYDVDGGRMPGVDELRAFHDWYRMYHGYLSAVVCTFGIVANIANIIVLTRRSMLSAINCILTGLAVSDGLTMAAYLPFALRFYVLYGVEPTPERNEQSAVRFMLFYARFSVVVHTTSIWLTVVMATFRYIFVRFPRYGVIWCTLQRAKLSVVAVYVASLIVCLPNIVTITMQSEYLNTTSDDAPSEKISSSSASADYAVVGHRVEGADNVTAENVTDVVTSSTLSTTTVQIHTAPSATYSLPPSAVIWAVRFKRETESDKALFVFNFWVQAILVRLVPCLVLTLLSALLVRTMRRAAARRRSLGTSHSGQRTAGQRRWRQTNRTTRMLLTVVTLFLVTELPQGVTNIMSGIGDRFVEDVYNNLGDLIDILALVNNGINFILYCTMSQQFRRTFVDVFLSRCSNPCSTRGAITSSRPSAGHSASAGHGGPATSGTRSALAIRRKHGMAVIDTRVT